MGLTIYRLGFVKTATKRLPLTLCIVGGIIVMWNLQRELIQYLVDSADTEDKIASVALSVLATQAAEGGLKTLTGQPLVSAKITSFEKKLVTALFPAAALHSDDRTEQINAWLDQVPANPAAIYPTYFTPENSFKNLIVPLIAIGLSVFFRARKPIFTDLIFYRNNLHKIQARSTGIRLNVSLVDIDSMDTRSVPCERLRGFYAIRAMEQRSRPSSLS